MQINKSIMEFFASLADETRLTIVMTLIKEPKTVTDIQRSIKEISLSGISHQLKILKSASIVSSKKKGREKTYSLSDAFCWCILRDAQNHFKGKTGCKECLKIKNEQ